MTTIANTIRGLIGMPPRTLDPDGEVEAAADRVCAVTGIVRVRRADAARVTSARFDGRVAAAAALRQLADDLERSL